MNDVSNDMPPSNMTRANITGKVTQTEIHRGRRGKVKRVKLEQHQKSHVRQLQKRGQISPKAAASHGLQGKK